jgi:hypothetical protein
MNRATFILGFSLLVVAATLAVSITLRNAPGTGLETARHAISTPRVTHNRAPQAPANAGGPCRVDPAARKPDVLRVALPEPWLATLSDAQQGAWRSRAAAVESAARTRLEHLSTDLELNAAQREKMFPVLVRSAPGYDPVMLAGGSTAAAEASLAALEEIHQVLDPAQQALVEDQEVSRQLWWQDTLSRLEANLLEAAGGVAATPAVAAPAAGQPTPATQERGAPAARTTGNLFDVLEPKP